MERDRLLSFNERVKLVASFYNSLGLGLILGGLLRPLAAGATIPYRSMGLWVAGGLAFHALAIYILHHMKKEAGP